MVVDRSARQLGQGGARRGNLGVALVVGISHDGVGVGDIEIVADKSDAKWRIQMIEENALGVRHAVAISVAQKQLQEESRQIDRLREAIRTAKQSPYYLNASGEQRLYFAFVPYDNQTNAVAGAAVYDCYLNMIACRKVGTMAQIFPGEEQAMHPIFKTQIRGFLIQMNLYQDRSDSAKSKTVFLGRKPLLF